MSIIEEIKANRAALLTEEQKSKILANIKGQLLYDEEAIIEGAPHFQSQEWNFPEEKGYQCRAPYRCHAAISQWLRGLGFQTSRYYNRGGVEYGMSVRIR